MDETKGVTGRGPEESMAGEVCRCSVDLARSARFCAFGPLRA